MKQILGVFAKQPIAGQSKTRLGQTTSAQWAERVAMAFLEDSLDRFASVDADRVVVYSPGTALDFFAKIGRERYRLQAQREGNLGQRLHGFFETAFGAGATRVVAVGADSPTLPVAFLSLAFETLSTHDVVLGPAFDGGYYLVGMTRAYPGLFADIPWSTAEVLEKTVHRVSEASATLAILPMWYDVDTVQDWAMLRGHVRAMRAAGIDPGVPRTEQLMAEEAVLSSSKLTGPTINGTE